MCEGLACNGLAFFAFKKQPPAIKPGVLQSFNNHLEVREYG